jgi:Coenzyme PQQ synthesis protein D (PqqD)
LFLVELHITLSIPEDIVFRDLAGEVVILNLGTGMYFGLNTVGTQIWRLISEGCSSEQIVATLLEEYEIEEARVQKDLDILLEQLNDVGLITLHTARLTSAR